MLGPNLQQSEVPLAQSPLCTLFPLGAPSRPIWEPGWGTAVRPTWRQEWVLRFEREWGVCAAG